MNCPTCGAEVRVVSSGEGTSYYVPLYKEEMFALFKAMVKWFGEEPEMCPDWTQDKVYDEVRSAILQSRELIGKIEASRD